MKKRKIAFKSLSALFVLAVFFFFLVPSYIEAATSTGLVPCGGPTQPRCTLCHLFELLHNIVGFFLVNIVMPVSVLMVVIGGVMFVTSAGNPNNLGKAKSILKAVVIGLFIVFSAWILVNFFLVMIGVASWTNLESGWFEINCEP